ncbi:alpha-amylase family glycosyl hydrolase [Caldiplasma sukawensis]
MKPHIEKLNGYQWTVYFKIRREDRDVDAYVSGNFNCFGDGSIQLENEGDFWTGKVILQAGKYNYRYEINQYKYYNNEREPLDQEQFETIEIYQENFFHDPSQDRFYYSPDEFAEIIALNPTGKNPPMLIDNNESIISFIRSYETPYVSFYCFIVKGGEDYTFLDYDGNKYNFKPQYHENKEKNRVIYQIFPDRFYRKGDKEKGLIEWNSLPDSKSFYGGNISGIIEKLDYIKSLGCNIIYLNPHYRSRSNHRYDVDDYFSVDPLLGTMDDLKMLSFKLKENNMELMLDMVFNHTSTNFPKFRDENKADNWYHMYQEDYGKFKNVKGMPKLNHLNENVRNMVLDVIKFYYNEIGVRLFRYDVSDSIDLRAVEYYFKQLKKEIPEMLNIAEIWCDPQIFTESGLYDGFTNYFLRDLIIKISKGVISTKEMEGLLTMLNVHSGKLSLMNSMNVLSTHDTERIINILGRDLMLFSYTLLFMMDGMPLIYYGDETGLEGGSDPDCRRPYPWENQNVQMVEFFRKLIRIRNERKEMQTGHLFIKEENETIILQKILHNATTTLIFAKNEREINKVNIILGNKYVENEKNIIIEKNGFILY